MIGAVVNGEFDYSTSMSSHGNNFTVCTPCLDDKEYYASQFRACKFKNIILTKEDGLCTDQIDNFQENGIIELSRERSFGTLIKEQNMRRMLCIDYGKLANGNILTGFGAIWGESSFNECCMHVNKISRGDSTNKNPYWVTKKEGTGPFKPYELRFFKNNTNEGSVNNTNDKSLLGNVDNNNLCLELWIEEHKFQIKENISGC